MRKKKKRDQTECEKAVIELKQTSFLPQVVNAVKASLEDEVKALRGNFDALQKLLKMKTRELAKVRLI